MCAASPRFIVPSRPDDAPLVITGQSGFEHLYPARHASFSLVPWLNSSLAMFQLMHLSPPVIPRRPVYVNSAPQQAARYLRRQAESACGRIHRTRTLLGLRGEPNLRGRSPAAATLARIQPRVGLVDGMQGGAKSPLPEWSRERRRLLGRGGSEKLQLQASRTFGVMSNGRRGWPIIR